MASPSDIKLIECPRDAMQGIINFIPTQDKIEYLNLLLQVGFDSLDFGSFVSPQVIPQMADTVEVLEGLNLSGTETKLLAIVANLRGITQAAQYEAISYLGFPFSISETFQKRNTNTDINTTLVTVDKLLNACAKSGKTAVVYLSMAFGNPYGDEWNEEIVEYWASVLSEKGVSILALSDTVGTATSEQVGSLYKVLSKRFPAVEFGLHLHSTPDSWEKKVEAGFMNGCRRFDSAIKGLGGCPMASDELTGNIATENVINYLSNHGEILRVNMENFHSALNFSSVIFH
ncbi:MAG TPA: hydroxymethylglutaryl-CoA lyase [Pedobacter sp.]|jgi:hydroxymethylglutaryl-CoA lyase